MRARVQTMVSQKNGSGGVKGMLGVGTLMALKEGCLFGSEGCTEGLVERGEPVLG